MRAILIAVAGLLVLGSCNRFCGPDTCASGCCSIDDKCGVCPPNEGKAINVSVKNEYAESIFTLNVAQQGTLDEKNGPTSTASVRLLDMQRVGGSSTKRIDNAMRVNEQGELAFTLSAISLGNTHTFTGTFKVTDSTSTNDTLGFTYDYDLALAEFRITYGWKP